MQLDAINLATADEVTAGGEAHSAASRRGGEWCAALVRHLSGGFTLVAQRQLVGLVLFVADERDDGYFLVVKTPDPYATRHLYRSGSCSSSSCGARSRRA